MQSQTYENGRYAIQQVQLKGRLSRNGRHSRADESLTQLFCYTNDAKQKLIIQKNELINVYIAMRYA